MHDVFSIQRRKTPSYTPKNGFMDLQTIKNIIDETVEISNSQRILLTLHWIGEPLIHPDIVAILEHISRYPVLNLHLVTNGDCTATSNH